MGIPETPEVFWFCELRYVFERDEIWHCIWRGEKSFQAAFGSFTARRIERGAHGFDSAGDGKALVPVRSQQPRQQSV